MVRTIADVLAKADPVALKPDKTAYDAACLMAERNCGSVLVMDGDALLGIFTERDMIRRVVAERRDPGATTLPDVMTRDPDTIELASPALAALQMMEDGNYRHLPVVSEGRIVGVVSRRDFYGDEKAELERERRLWEIMG